MNRQSDVIENWEYGLLTLLNNALYLKKMMLLK